MSKRRRKNKIVVVLSREDKLAQAILIYDAQEKKSYKSAAKAADSNEKTLKK
jgi:LPS sulfotransferase NodH